MSADQATAYVPKPITQRDGSGLQFSNCRMASIATGLAYHTMGAQTSTGAKMRSFTTDQSGGTDSADAKQSWTKGYSQTLVIRDGNVWSTVIDALTAGRLVHLDVWHSAVGAAPGICLSGSGNYGHTIAVLPDSKAGSWLVADPWCKPAKWGRVPERQLRAGAEEWGRRVHQTAGNPALDNPRLAELLAAAVRQLMSAHNPDNPDDTGGPPADTSGPAPVLFTITKALAPASSGGGDVSINVSGLGLASDYIATVNKDGAGLFKEPGGEKFAAAKKGYVYPYTGVPATSGWRAVVVNTAILYNDGVARPTICYMAAADVETTKPVKPPTPPTNDTAAKQAQYDADAAALLGPRP